MVGAYLVVDMAHVAGLVATGLYPNPVPFADVVTSTTHKTLRGPRGGLILARANDEITKRLNSMVFPGTQGGPLMHVIAAKAVAFQEALQPEFRDYQVQVLANARAMAAAFQRRGYRVVSGGTDNHLFLLDLSDKSMTGKDADAALGKAHITVNKNAVPNDPRPPTITSGLRLGTPASTTRGFREAGDHAGGGLDHGHRRCQRGCRCRRPRARRSRRAVQALSGISNLSEGVTTQRFACEQACMHCPFCEHEETKVTDSRLAGGGAQIRRRRECLACGERFTTFESAELVMPLIVKSDQSREPFDEAKLRGGMEKALQKRPVESRGHRCRRQSHRWPAARPG